jgi:hypothetical protein
MRFAGLIIVCLLSALPVMLCGCKDESSAGTSVSTSPAPAPPTEWFADITAASGMDFVQRIARPEAYFMPDSMGSGGAFLDFNNDGRLDIFCVQEAGPTSSHTHKLYRQEADGRFTDVTAGSGLDIAGYGQGVAIGDVNNDGLVDIFLAEYLGARLLINQGGTGRFVDATSPSGIKNPYWAVSAAFLDYDRDGWLDLVIANYVRYEESHTCNDANGAPEYCGPGSFQPLVSRLFRNLGPGDGKAARFQDVTTTSGLESAPSSGMAVICADFTGDDWQDILITNDERPNHLWINQQNGMFAEEAVVRGVAFNGLGMAQANMGVGLGDIQPDGRLDFVVPHLTGEGNVLWTDEGDGHFRDATATTGLATPKWRATGFGAVMEDFDNDGDEDVVVLNGRVSRAQFVTHSEEAKARLGRWSGYADRNQIFTNDGSGRFLDVSPDQKAFCGQPNVGRGLVSGDIDNDGKLDLLVTCIDAPARLYRNVSQTGGHWLTVRVVDPAAGGRDAYGARIIVTAAGKTRMNVAAPTEAIFCSGDPRVHFGLGQAASVERVQVTWPDGVTEQFPGQTVDQFITLAKGQGTVVLR